MEEDPTIADAPPFCHRTALRGLLLIALPKSALDPGVCRCPFCVLCLNAPTEIRSHLLRFFTPASSCAWSVVELVAVGVEEALGSSDII